MVLLKQINSSSHCFEKNNSNSILRVFFSGSPEHTSRHTPLGSGPSCKIQRRPLLLVTRAQHRRFVQTRALLLNFTCCGPLLRRGDRGDEEGATTEDNGDEMFFRFFILRCNSFYSFDSKEKKIFHYHPMLCPCYPFFNNPHPCCHSTTNTTTGRFVTVAASGSLHR